MRSTLIGIGRLRPSRIESHISTKICDIRNPGVRAIEKTGSRWFMHSGRNGERTASLQMFKDRAEKWKRAFKRRNNKYTTTSIYEGGYLLASNPSIHHLFHHEIEKNVLRDPRLHDIPMTIRWGVLHIFAIGIE